MFAYNAGDGKLYPTAMIVNAGECDPTAEPSEFIEPAAGDGGLYPPPETFPVIKPTTPVKPSQSPNKNCGTRPFDNSSDSEPNTFISDQVALLQANREGFLGKPGLAGSTLFAKVNVFWHIVYAGGTQRWNGNLTMDDINSQMDVLNRDYDGRVQFNFAGVDFTIAPVWFHYEDNHNDMKSKLRQGGPSDLNIYTVNFSFSGILGYATFPWDLTNDTLPIDGVVMKHNTVPTFPDPPYNLGKTLTHEVGHWLGLYHTFQGGCVGDGDFVDDTPAVAKPNGGCPSTPVDSCPDQPGNDLLNDFMDYTDDM
ncbi:hypothetical protein HDU97_001886 [Phlyctochytrium planicorne]|nr:hypothetical protein HDU97_001886 [Phlyctochytrium planicorne]